MKALTLTSAALLFCANVAAAQGNPGAHFIENWDLNADGQVTLAEATERRDNIFATFDADEDGALNAEEYDLFDEARANDMAENGMGGKGAGQGGGQGGGQGHGKMNPANGMMRKFTDVNGDGTVTRDEFMASIPDWYARMDKNADGTVTVEDFTR